MLALISYPFWVERHLPLKGQALAWSIGFGAFALLAGGCAWLLARARASHEPQALDLARPPT
ncbi:hypothetical protein, partial [Salmonella enterica]|uniref:hypothetical protein n=1 Tax=Salmonella enterica TaxID=28901 RepID=UPI003298E8C1